MNDADYIQVPQQDGPVVFHGPAFVPQWIPVHDALPERLAPVFFVRRGEVYRGWFDTLPFAHFCTESCHRYWLSTEKVTHWMSNPTPEPPKI